MTRLVVLLVIAGCGSKPTEPAQKGSAVVPTASLEAPGEVEADATFDPRCAVDHRAIARHEDVRCTRHRNCVRSAVRGARMSYPTRITTLTLTSRALSRERAAKHHHREGPFG